MSRATVAVRVKRTVTVKTTFEFAARVCHSCDGEPGIARMRARSGFRYRTADGATVRDPLTLARIAALAVPPAWERVWICPAADGHLQATGRDARGRKQYRYHPTFRSARDGDKFGRLSAFGLSLPRIRRRVAADLALPGLPRERVLAAVVKLLDQTHLRVGNAEYARANKSFGLTTLLDRHVSFEGGSLRVRFRGKSGVWHDREVSDAALARVVRKCRDIPGQDLFQYRDGRGAFHPIGSADVNEYLREAADGAFTAKDFRTWAGTVEAVARLSALPPPASRTAAEKAVVGVLREVAAELGNTLAVCRKSYVHPRALEAFAAGTLPPGGRRAGLSPAEGRTLHLLMN